MSPRKSRIADLNELLRETFLAGRIILTEGITALPDEVRAEVLSGVRTFSNFTADNDPYGEHDFGAIDVAGAGKVFWKIDYYDRDYLYHSLDAADPTVTSRVLTIMLAGEY